MKALIEVRSLLGKNLGSTFLFLSAVSMAACSPSDSSEALLADVAHAAARQDDRVSVEELAGWLIEGRGDFRLIDVRSAEDFDKGRIGEAENISITQLVSADVLSGLPTDRMVIVYSNGSENAAKATVMLRLSGIDAHLLTGGFCGYSWSGNIFCCKRYTGESIFRCIYCGGRSLQTRRFYHSRFR